MPISLAPIRVRPRVISSFISVFDSVFTSFSSQRFTGVSAFQLHRHFQTQSQINRTNVVMSQQKINSKYSISLQHHDRKVLPSKGNDNILITSALPYVNNVPHLGNIIGCVLSADVFARYNRISGKNTLYICGTDEYGTATETKALEEGVSCQELCDKYHELHKQIYQWFEIDFDHFGRTTTEWQTKIAQHIFTQLHTRNQLIKDTLQLLYCPSCTRYLADRYVEGTCPNCHYTDARGDQCDACGKLLNASELVEPRCKLCTSNAKTPEEKAKLQRPTMRNSEHLFLDLPNLQQACEEWFTNAAKQGQWSENGVSITKALLKEGLKQRCITRDLKWGTPVPLESMKDKVFYVWFDAPIGYLSITANYTNEWEQWWRDPENVKLYQFMGKDNIPFHSVIFPCSLIGTGEKWTLVHHISTTEYLNYESGKFSKSRNVGVFGNNVKDSGVPVSVWRYYLLSSRPETNDSMFLWKEFIARNNGELLANLGNFVNRVLKFITAKYDGVIPAYDINDEVEQVLVKDVNKLLGDYITSLDNVKIRNGLVTSMTISSRGNLYLQDNKLDNNLFANNRKRCDTVVAVAANLVYLLSTLLYPYMPSTTESILRQLNAPLRKMTPEWTCDEVLEGHVIGKPEYLFKRIDEKMEEVFRSKYGGGNSTEAPTKPEKKSKKKGSSASKEPVIPEGMVKTPEMEQFEKDIKEQGDLIRKMKSEKADANAVIVEVDKLKALKEAFGKLIISATSSVDGNANGDVKH